ncbi:MAG TPA: YciI family protein [Mycobacterium sp.]|nr:YciI family protein [Mycobacterium sp.]
MHYFALLLSPENTRPADPAEQAAEMAAYRNFHAIAGRFIRGGDALLPSATGVRITGGPDKPSVTDGPFAEGAEVAGGYYVFEADNLDEALGLAGQIPAAKYGAVEIWPMAAAGTTAPLEGTNWLALLLEPPAVPVTPGSDQWQQGVARHVEFGAAAGEHVKGGAGLHPPSTATTVTVRDGKVSFTDGPFVEGAEVANGFYVLSATDRHEAVKIASMIPATSVELRQLAGVSGL